MLSLDFSVMRLPFDLGLKIITHKRLLLPFLPLLIIFFDVIQLSVMLDHLVPHRKHLFLLCV